MLGGKLAEMENESLKKRINFLNVILKGKSVKMEDILSLSTCTIKGRTKCENGGHFDILKGQKKVKKY